MATIIASANSSEFLLADLANPDSLGRASGSFIVDGVPLVTGGVFVPIDISGNDSITDAGAFPDNLYGGFGNDTITDAGGDRNTLSGGAGSDSITAGAGNQDILRGGASVALFSAAGDDTLVDLGGWGNTLIGDAGRDRITAGG